MKLEKAIYRNERPAYIHNPKHFYSNSFQRSIDLKGRTVITGQARSKSKPFKIVCILKPDKSAYRTQKEMSRRLL